MTMPHLGSSAMRIRVVGYLPCRLVTNKENARGEVMVQFENGTRRWFDAAKVDRT